MIDEYNNDRTGWARFSDDRMYLKGGTEPQEWLS